MSSADTIFALATPPGKSGVAVVRLSGSEALSVLQDLSGIDILPPRTAHYLTLRDGNDILDKAIALYFKAPMSFTGEDVVELQMHGSLAVIRQLLGLLASRFKLRPADPGEFSRRAFANGKMDLIEAEGMADLIDAETPAQKTQAMRQLQGENSRHYEALRKGIVECLAHLEAYIDFPDEDIPTSVLEGLDRQIKALKQHIEPALRDASGERLRDGINVVILGAPNAGKSSLLNAIARRDAAIVSARAGTTRDLIEVHLNIAGFPAVLVDTAGLRNAQDEIEEEGVKRALARAQDADIKLVLFDGASTEWDKQSLALVDEGALVAVNKSDIQILSTKQLPFKNNIFAISAKTGQGVETLLTELERRITGFFSGETSFITRERHRALLTEALDHLRKAAQPAPLELRCEELRIAAQAVGKITGKIGVEDVLDVIFKQFCIGK